VGTFLKQDPFQERILVSQHETLVSCTPMGGLQVVKIGLMHPDGLFQLLDVLRSAFSKRSLSLAVTLLPLFGSGIDLEGVSTNMSPRGATS
jgi:hypothetical protein